jgi:hypothetical protein
MRQLTLSFIQVTGLTQVAWVHQPDKHALFFSFSTLTQRVCETSVNIADHFLFFSQFNALICYHSAYTY